MKEKMRRKQGAGRQRQCTMGVEVQIQAAARNKLVNKKESFLVNTKAQKRDYVWMVQRTCYHKLPAESFGAFTILPHHFLYCYRTSATDPNPPSVHSA